MLSAMGGHCRLALLFLLAASGMRPFDAAAQPVEEGSEKKEASPEAEETPDSLFLQAKKLMASGDYKSACGAFERSYALEPKVTSLVNLANCRELNGELFTAWRLFLETATEMETATGNESAALRDLARRRAEALTPRLSGVVVEVAGGLAELEVRINDFTVDPQDLGKVMYRDGGAVEVCATAAGHQAWCRKVSLLAEGDVQVVKVPALVALPRAANIPRQPVRATMKKETGFVSDVAFEGGMVFVAGMADEVYARTGYYGYSFGKITNHQTPASGYRFALNLLFRREMEGGYEFGVETERVDDSGVDGRVVRFERVEASEVCKCNASFSRLALHGRYTSLELAGGVRLYGDMSWQTVGVGFDETQVSYDYLGFAAGLRWEFSDRWSLWLDTSPFIYGSYEVARYDSKEGDGSFVGWGQAAGLRYSSSPHGRGYYVEFGLRENNFDLGGRDAQAEVSARYLALGGRL